MRIHLGETVALKRKTVAVGEVAHYLRERGVPAESMNIGGTIELDGVSFTDDTGSPFLTDRG